MAQPGAAQASGARGKGPGGARPLPEPPPVPTLPLFGLDFANLPLPAVVNWLAARPAGARFGYVVTPNADHLARMQRMPEMRQLYTAAMLRLLDSRVAAGAARLAGLPVPAVLPGSDLTAFIVRRILRPEEPVTILGMTEEAVAALAERCGLRNIAHYNPPMGFDQDPAEMERAIRFIEDNPARFHFLAVGSPRQCRVANAVARRGRATGTGLCIGASLLFLSGHERRAPLALQRAGLEWAWRLAQDPQRLARRYLMDSPRMFLLIRDDARQRRLARADRY
ncbi:WecB/TagA/CpsF family glycosyltransferase [Paracraurococcus lichenis]|uniref:WecB/TagA/CpsF family glycosyltransferase n=1 Tax=Paracraurococcus lichenis TaxID=3064888 RepID=A0ABT9DWG6_9PROT|nr:WecB/TagA/CpsF family glycosyltransferase [Paracraurococcus sp. LOR1-02]MDO9708241.1 WecB/TagA/CpsF family glycosyltransferase [Paracraurococcus sp. LOR1-02]